MKFVSSYQKGGLAFIIIRSFIVFSIILFAMISTAYLGIKWYMNHTLPLNRIELLINKAPHMSDLDFMRMDSGYYVGNGGSFFLVNEDGSIIYTNDDNSYSDFLAGELACIQEYNAKLTNSISEYPSENGEKRYLLTREYRANNGVRKIQGYILMDTNRNIIESTLFTNKTSLSRKEFYYLSGFNQKGLAIQKHSYQNSSGQNRILVFTTETTLQKDYLNAITCLNNIWRYFIPLYIFSVMCCIYFLNRKMKSLLQPIKKLIKSTDGETESKETGLSLSDELLEIADKYNRLSERLVQSEWQRDYLDISRNKLLADISHDLRTPTTVIQGYALALRDGIVPSNQQRDYIETILRKAERVTELVSTFHEYSKLEHPEMPINLSKQDICSILQVFFANKYAELELAGFRLEAEIPEHSVYCKVDSKLFCRAIENLVNNSLKYNPSGTIVFVKVEKMNEHAKIYIGDTGIGIPEEIYEKIFEPFIIGESSRSVAHGSGLGLAIAKKIIVSHHGTIHFINHSQHHCKTEFEISLSLAT